MCVNLSIPNIQIIIKTGHSIRNIYKQEKSYIKKY